MFKEVLFETKKKTDEAEFAGRPEAGSSIKFGRFLDWMSKVNASSNAKYLKCITPKSGVISIFNIVDIKFSINVIHKDVVHPAAIKIAFKEDATEDAMTLAHAAELFEAVKNACEENGHEYANAEMFIEDPNGKLTRFAWYYDDASDTAVVIKNISPGQAKKFLNGTVKTIAELASTPRNPRQLVDKLQAQIDAIDQKIKALTARRADLEKKLAQNDIDIEDTVVDTNFEV